MINVGIDGQIFAFQNTGSISRYFTYLLSKSSLLKEVALIPVFEKHRNHYLANCGIGKFTQDDLLQEVSMKFAEDAERFEDNSEIVHSTYYLGSPSLYRDKPLVTTLHDMIAECYSEMPSLKKPSGNKSTWLKYCDAIVCVSKSSADDLLIVSPEYENKLKVIHLGIERDSLLEAQADRLASSIKWPIYQYFLHVGSRSGYKNGMMLLQSYIKSSAPRDDIHLVFVGGEQVTKSEKSLMSTCGIEDKIHFLRPSDIELYLLYKHAIALLAPSRSEGFSLPLIEALSFDTPVICSEIPAHIEVAENYAHFLSPVLPSAWSEVLSNQKYLLRPSQYLLASYKDLVSYFSIDRMLLEHQELYTSLA